MGQLARVVKELVEPYEGENHVLYCDSLYTSGPLANYLAERKVYLVGTIQKDARGFPECLKACVPRKGEYRCTSVGDIQYFVYHDRKVVRFITNVFPASMDHKVPVLQPQGILVEQTVPPLLPAYNKYMGGVDLTDQLQRYYAFDRKSTRSWLRVFFHLFDIAVDNAHILYKHNCRKTGIKCQDLLAFRLKLVHLLLDGADRRKRRRVIGREKTEDNSPGECRLVGVGEVGLKRGRCTHCLSARDKKDRRFTSYACASCCVRLCKVDCFAAYHRHDP